MTTADIIQDGQMFVSLLEKYVDLTDRHINNPVEALTAISDSKTIIQHRVEVIKENLAKNEAVSLTDLVNLRTDKQNLVIYETQIIESFADFKAQAESIISEIESI